MYERCIRWNLIVLSIPSIHLDLDVEKMIIKVAVTPGYRSHFKANRGELHLRLGVEIAFLVSKHDSQDEMICKSWTSSCSDVGHGQAPGMFLLDESLEKCTQQLDVECEHCRVE